MKKEKTWFENNFALIIIITSIVIVGLTFLTYVLNNSFCIFDQLATDKLGQFGDFIGGFLGTFLTIVATVYIYKTYVSQKEELELQRKLIAQQQFESTFFNMLNVHRELKNNLKLNKSKPIFIYTPNNEDVFGVEVFKIIYKDYIKIYKNLISQNISELKDYRILKDFIKEAIESEPDFIKKINEDETNPKASSLDENWNENNNSKVTHKKKIEFCYRILYKNYQNELSHYCRNVYHILKFIRKTEAEDNILKVDKRLYYKKYTNILQSQLNVYEHLILFYNFILFSENDEENEIYYPINLVNRYEFLENIGVDNLILNNHKKQYEFQIKGD